jgi:hypothetical protein
LGASLAPLQSIAYNRIKCDRPQSQITITINFKLMMEAYKFKGKIDSVGHLILTESIPCNPGEVEVIVLQAKANLKEAASLETPTETAGKKRPAKVKAFQDWFEKTQPAPLDFDPDQARWEALKEKYEL